MQEKEIFGNKVHPQKDEDNLSNKSFNDYKDKTGVILEKPSKETSRSSVYGSDDEKKDASKEDLGEGNAVFFSVCVQDNLRMYVTRIFILCCM